MAKCKLDMAQSNMHAHTNTHRSNPITCGGTTAFNVSPCSHWQTRSSKSGPVDPRVKVS
jgi:hypothetical protein